ALAERAEERGRAVERDRRCDQRNHAQERRPDAPDFGGDRQGQPARGDRRGHPAPRARAADPDGGGSARDPPRRHAAAPPGRDRTGPAARGRAAATGGAGAAVLTYSASPSGGGLQHRCRQPRLDAHTTFPSRPLSASPASVSDSFPTGVESMSHLTGKRVAILATDGFEQSELLEPVKALKEHRADVDIVSPRDGKLQGFKHFDKDERVTVDVQLAQADAGRYDALVI